jgi:DNA-binding transcriptional ArsR family regulator
MEDVSRYYTLLKDPTRRRIIKMLGDRGKIGFKELKEELKLSVGTIYYHLDMLADFLTQDEQRKYLLNDDGKLLYKLLKTGLLPPTLEIKEAVGHRLGRYFLFSPIFAKAVRPIRLLPISILILAIGAIGSALAKIDPILFFYFPSKNDFITISISFILQWISLFLFLDVMIYLLYRRVGGDFQLFICISISSFPLAIFPYIYLHIPPNFAMYILLITQIWCLLLLSSASCFGKGLRFDKSIVISLITLYINIALLVFLGYL